jgi:hypothetical protein
MPPGQQQQPGGYPPYPVQYPVSNAFSSGSTTISNLPYSRALIRARIHNSSLVPIRRRPISLISSRTSRRRTRTQQTQILSNDSSILALFFILSIFLDISHNESFVLLLLKQFYKILILSSLHMFFFY